MLVCTGGTRTGEVMDVREGGGLSIGRASDNSVVLEDADVSRYHASLLYENGSLWIQDVGSRNGIFVNGTRLTTHQALKVGDVVAIADHTFAVWWKSDIEDDTEESPIKGPHKRGWFWPFDAII